MLQRTLPAMILSFVLAVSVVTLESAAYAQQVSEGQRLAMYSKPAVVRIYDGYRGKFYWPKNNRLYSVSTVGKGSGFFIHPNGYIVTNAHVTEDTREGVAQGKRKLFLRFVAALARDYGADPRKVLNNPQLLDSIARQAGTEPRDFQHIHHVVIPDGSVYPFEIKSYGAPTGEGKDVSVIKIEVKNAPILRLGDSDKVQLQDHITVFGYPAAADTSQSDTLDQRSALEASITDGKISARKSAADGAPVLQVSAPATHGSSGGPVTNDQGEVIGILTFRGDTVNGQEVSGFAFAVPTSTIQEFVKQAGTTNEPGLADKRYREGLELYWQGRYSRAITKFEEVKRLFPQHSETERLIRDSQQAIAEGKEQWGFFGWFMLLAVGGFGLVLFAGVGAALLVFTPPGKRLRVALRSAFASSQVQPGRADSQQWSSHQVPSPSPAQSSPQAPSAHPVPPARAGQVPPLPSPAPSSQSERKRITASLHLSASTPARSKPNSAPDDASTDPVGLMECAGLKTEPLIFGAIVFTTGPLAGQQFDLPAEGLYIGRDSSLAQVVIADSRISKRHLWVGVRSGRMAVVDQGSSNGTFLNVSESERVTAAFLNPGDTVLISGADVARFTYRQLSARDHLKVVNHSAA
jgi:serine protease Do